MPLLDDLPECGVARFLVLLDGPWATLIVRELLHGPLRFTEIKARLPGISAHTLTNRLRRFELNGLVTRTAYPEIPPRVVYELTEVGERLRTVLEAMNSWALSVPGGPDKASSTDTPGSEAPACTDDPSKMRTRTAARIGASALVGHETTHGWTAMNAIAVE